ncbi:fatty-acid amide hydrolase 2-B-like [Engraulis encrasicolus]|uniref:fatty-acid amide hydrolase 2-B-like n=1 Tax=Engraulis encrasicolus TaxID=184585 RepID=UPI002FCF9324
MALSYVKRLQMWVTKAVMACLYALFWLLAPKPKAGAPTKVPPVTNPLLKLSATQLAKKICRKEVSSVELVQAHIERIQEVNPLLNALVKDRFSAALLEAAQVDRMIEEKTTGEEEDLAEQLPLLGVPFSVKGSFALQGMPHTSGLRSRVGVLASTDAPPVAYMKKAGAIPLGVTNVPELCMWFECHNRLHGITNNPYRLDSIPGGSSGGEGSLISAGGAVIGMGTDIGGSIRMPSFFNGIFGHKTTSQVVSNDGQHPPCSGRHEDYVSSGPMCRYAEDLLPMLKIMAGPNAQQLSLSQPVELNKLRFFSVLHDGGSPYTSPVDKQLIQAQRQVVAHLESDLGVKVQELCLPELQNAYRIWEVYMGLPDKDGKPPQPFAELMGEGGPSVWPPWELLKWMLGRSSHTMAAIRMALLEMVSGKPPQFILQQKEALERRLEELLGTDGVLLYPPHPLLGYKHHHPLFKPFNFAYTGIFNTLGLPVTQCPLGLSREGLPLGVQVIAWKHQDHLTLASALYLEKAFGGWRDPGAL